MNSADEYERALGRLEQRINHVFADRDLLRQALTHRSAGPIHNERLEFLGDGVLNFVIAAALFEQNLDAPEGDLSRQRAALVRETTLAAIADEIELGDLLVFGPGEQGSGSRRRASIRADGVEAVLGAVYCDAGFAATRDVITRLYAQRLADLPSAASLKDAKTRLQEWLQARGRNRPEYELIEVTGADHCQHFTAGCHLADSGVRVEGQGNSRRLAEQDAARRMLSLIDADADTDADAPR